MDEEEIFDGEFSDLPDDAEFDDFGDEEMGDEEEADFDDEDELLEAPAGALEPVSKARPVEEKENIEVTQRFFDKLKGQLSRKPGAGSLKLFLQVFVDLLNDETKDRFRKRAFIVTDLKLLNAIVKYGVEEFPSILEASAGFRVEGDQVIIKREKMEVLIKTLCNNLVKFLGQQTETTMIIFVCRAIRQHVNLFRVNVVGLFDKAKSSQTGTCLSPTLGRKPDYSSQARGYSGSQRGCQVR